MKKIKLLVILGVIIAIAVSLMAISGCKAETVAPETVVVTETVVVKETVIVEEDVLSGFEMFNSLREAAKKGEAYPGAPATGKTCGYGDIIGGIPFAISVWENTKKNWELAGGKLDDLYYVDNQYNAQIGLQNSDIMLAKNPNGLIWFQADSKVNSITANKFGAANIPIVAIDVPVPGAPFMGVNNFKVAYMAGEKAIELVEAQGGIDSFQSLILMQMPVGGEVTMLRSEGFYQAFVDKYGADKIDPMTIRADGGTGEAEQANKSMTDVLASIPNTKKAILTSINEQTMSGIIAAIETAGRWNADDWVIITQGCDDVGKAQIREGLTDATIAYFPETYGQYIIPTIVTLMAGQPVPPFIYIENEVITKDNIDQFYPQ